MRTIKFLGLAVALAAAAVPALAQAGLQPGAFPAIDNLARREAQRIEHQQQMRRFAGQRAGRMGMGYGVHQGRGFIGQGRAFAGLRQGFRAGARAGVRAGVRAGFAAGKRAGLRANATPEQKAFVEQFRAQRESVRAQVLEGKLTREQARTQMQKWAAEHRPKK